MYQTTTSKYAEMDPIPKKLMDSLIANGTLPSVASYYNSFCDRNLIRKFKGTITEWCVIETCVFVGLNIAMMLMMFRRNFMSVTRDYSFDFTQ